MINNMWYFNFNTAEEFFEYQKILLKNWVRGSRFMVNPAPVSPLYRGTGRTTAEFKCIIELLSRGNTVLYVVQSIAFLKSLHRDPIVVSNKDQLKIISFKKFNDDPLGYCTSNRSNYFVFDHRVLEENLPPFP